MMPSQHKTHLHWPRPRLSERLTQIKKYLQKEHTLHGSYSEMKAISNGYFRDLNFDHVSVYSSIGLLYAFTGRDSRIGRCL